MYWQGHNLAVADVDGDGVKEMITGGSSYNYMSNGSRTPRYAPLKIWNWNGNTLTLKQSKDWIVGEGVSAWNVGTGDVDNDGIVEIVTVGCMQTIILADCDPDLRIWSIPNVPSVSFPYLVVAIVGVTVATVGAIGAAFLFTRRKLPKP